MRVRDIPTAEILDDSEEFVMAYVLLIEALIDLEQSMPSFYAEPLTDLLNAEAHS